MPLKPPRHPPGLLPSRTTLVLLLVLLSLLASTTIQAYLPSFHPQRSSNRGLASIITTTATKAGGNCSDEGEGSSQTWFEMITQRRDDFMAMVLEMEHQAQLEVAEALLGFIRKSTNGGLMPMVDGSLPKLDASQKEVLSKCVPEVLRIMERLEKSETLDHDGRVLLYMTEAMGYDLSFRSLMQTVGHLPRITRNLDRLVTAWPDLMGGAPLLVRGMMYMNAPKPVRDVRKAREYFEAAVKIDPSMPRNHYYCGVAAVLQKDLGAAYRYFSNTIQMLNDDKEEEEAWHHMHHQSQRGLQLTSSSRGEL